MWQSCLAATAIQDVTKIAEICAKNLHKAKKLIS